MIFLGYIMNFCEGGPQKEVLIESRLSRALNDSYRTAFGHTDSEAKLIDESGTIKATQKEMKIINAVISAVLDLIGQHSNSRFGKNQDLFFKRFAEQETFLVHLSKSILMYKQGLLSEGLPNLNHLPPFTGEMLQEVHAQIPPKERKLQLGGMLLSEKQIYAFSFFYYVSFLIDAYAKGDTARFSQLMSLWLHFKDGVNYSVGLGKKGGSVLNKKWNSRKSKAYQLFVENEVMQNFGPSKEAIASRLKELCTSNKVRVSEATLRTRWVNDFIDKSKA